MPRNIESTLNTELGRLLCDRNSSWVLNETVFTECTGIIKESAGSRPDLLVHPVGGQPVAIETEFRAGKQVEREAQSRLGKTVKKTQDTIECAIAVAMPDELRKSPQSLGHVEFQFSTHQLDKENQSVRWPHRDWLRGRVDRLADAIEYVSLSERRLQIGASTLEETIIGVSETLRRESNRYIHEEIAEILQQQSSEQTIRMAVAILTNALVFHCSIEGERNIPRILTIRERKFSESSIHDTWDQILEVNYWPIFSIAKKILRCIPTPLVPKIFRRLNEAAENLVALGSGTFHDLSGRMFQKLITDRKFLATFYTLPASAKLLADLAVDRIKGVDWADDESISHLRVADFACGTGALLSAVQREIYRRFRRTGGDDASIHRTVIEHVLIGTDIMPAATHITASMLSSPHPRVIYRNSLIHTLPYGKHSDEFISIGALDLLDSDYTLSLFDTSPKTKRMDGREETRDSDPYKEFNIPDVSCDLVIMNPPFTRPTNHEIATVPVPSFAGFQTTSGEQKVMSAKLKEIAPRIKRNRRGLFGSGHAGLASNFMDLAHAKLKEGGVLAMVLPFSFTVGASWKNARRMLHECYDQIRIIAISTDGSKDRAFSADTGMAECLLIATKVRSIAGKVKNGGRAEFSSLRSRPATPLEAGVAADLIRHDHDFDDSILDAGGVGVRQKSIYKCVHILRTGTLEFPRINRKFSVPMVELGKIAERGVVHREISNDQQGAFNVRAIHENEAPTFPMLWAHDCEKERCLIVHPDSCGDVRPDRKENAIRIWQTASRLHSTLDFQLNSQSLSMCITLEPCIGGTAWPNVIPHDDNHEIPLLLWANSTLGLIMFWYVGTRQQQGRARLTISRLKELSVLDVRALTERQIELCHTIFHDFKERRFLPANEAYRDPARKDLDIKLFTMLGLDQSLLVELDMLREQWCREPSVHGGKVTHP